MPISDLSDADIDAVYATISEAHGIEILKAERRARLLEQEKAPATRRSRSDPGRERVQRRAARKRLASPVTCPRAGKISVDVVFGEIFITARGGRMLRIKKQ
jgi:hypothetical protein